MVATLPLAPPIAELVLEFVAPRLETVDDKPRAAGTLTLKYKPVGVGRGIDGVATDFISPLGPDDADELRWYIEDYCRWPWGVFRNRAQSIEAKIQRWGRKLYDAIAASTRNARAIAEFIRDKASDGSRIDKRITICVDHRDTENKDAAALLFGLPWELLHDEDSYLFDGAVKARVRRTLPSETVREQVEPRQRVRVLLVRARPEDDQAKFIDPRSSALPLVETLHELGDQVKIDTLSDGTFNALQKALTHAEDERDPYQVVHFDGHGVYDKVRGLGLLCFEDAEDVRLGRERRRSHNMPAKEIGALLRDRRVALFVLDACQTAMAETNVDTSVAAELLRQGVVSVVAMRYAVLLSTAKRFVEAFYGALAKGYRIGRAMVEAQHALKSAPVRSDFGSKGPLELQDWMVPVLFQEGDDPQIFVGGVDMNPAAVEARKHDDDCRRGELHAKPLHGFVGRARDLLRIERRISRTRRVSIVGAGGEGKTALAVEAAHWFLLSKQRERVAFVSVERLSDARAVLDAVGRLLVPGYSVAMVEAGGSDPIRPVKSALLKERTLLVVDNFESLIALTDKDPTNAEAVRDIVKLVHELADVTGTWLITTSRESLPAPLEGEELRIGSLDLPDARELLANVLREKGIEPQYERKAAAELEQAITSLIEAVRGHARSLVLLGPNIAGRGIEATRDAIRHEMVALEKRYPGDRERSLLASVRVSLDRLNPETRKKIAPLCVFRQAAPFMLMPFVLELEPHEVIEVSEKLVELGLAQMNGPYVLPDPALSEALAPELHPTLQYGAEQRWREGMWLFARYLHQQEAGNARIARLGTHVVQSDLLAALEATMREVQEGRISADFAMGYAANLESLIAQISNSRALARTRAVRETLTKMLPTWSHGRFLAQSEEIDRCCDTRDFRSALMLAKQLRDQAELADEAFSEAEYDRALSWMIYGDVLKECGFADQALEVLEEARKRLAKLAEEGVTSAIQMESSVLNSLGNALSALGRLDHAAGKHEEALKCAESRGDMRSVAVSLGGIGAVRLDQGRLAEALEIGQRSLEQWNALGEPVSVATAWHHLGQVQERAGQFMAAENAYKEALRTWVFLGNSAHEAVELTQLSSLCLRQNRFQDAAAFLRQSIMAYENLGDEVAKAKAHCNLGVTLHKLGQFAEARDELYTAIAIKSQHGHAATPWNAYTALARVERDARRTDAAAEAHSMARKTYRAHRLAGGETTVEGPAQLVVDVSKRLNTEGYESARLLLQQVHSNDLPKDPPAWITLLRVLDTIVAGNRDAALANNPVFDPTTVVELQLLLENLSRIE